MTDLLSQVEQELSNLTPDQIREALVTARAAAEKRKAKQAEYNKKPETAEKRKQYMEKRLAEDPEGFKAKRKEYNEKPEVKERRKNYMAKRNARLKALVARAEELGIKIEDAPQAETQPSA